MSNGEATIKKEGTIIDDPLQTKYKKGKVRKLPKLQQPKVDLFDLLRLFWDEAPYKEGFKASIAGLYWAIVDSLNRNFWNPVHLSLEVILNKAKMDKKTYLAARQWLVDNYYLVVEAGKNNHQMAKFLLGSAVEKSPGTSPANYSSTGSSTHPLHPPAYTPNIKQETINNKTRDSNYISASKIFYENELKENSSKEWIEKYRSLANFLFGKNDLVEPLNNILKMPKQISYGSYLSVLELEQKTNIDHQVVLISMNNWKKLNSQNDSAAATLMNWMRREADKQSNGGGYNKAGRSAINDLHRNAY